MTKHFLRTAFKKRRNTLTIRQVEFLSSLLREQLKNSGFDFNNKKICTFLPIANSKEVNTYTILNHSVFKDSFLYLTKTNFQEKKMDVFLVEDIRNTSLNKLHIPEPMDGLLANSMELDIVFVPLLTYSKVGHRVGYGGGFYDRFLRNIKAKKIGLSLFDEFSHIVDIDSNDVPLDYCITPFKCIRFER